MASAEKGGVSESGKDSKNVEIAALKLKGNEVNVEGVTKASDEGSDNFSSVDTLALDLALHSYTCQEHRYNDASIIQLWEDKRARNRNAVAWYI
jgi:hypothetical protein